MGDLKKQKENVQEQFEVARKRLTIAESNDVFQGMQTSIQNLEHLINTVQIRIKQEEEYLAKLLRFQRALSAELSWTLENLDEDSTKYLLHIAEEGYAIEKKRKELIAYFERMAKRQEGLGTEKVHLTDEVEAIKQELARLEQQLKVLESNRVIYHSGRAVLSRRNEGSAG